MADKRFNIVFSGKLSEGSKPPEVLDKLCTVLGLESAQVRALFKPGAGAVIRKDLDGRTARAFLEKLLATGVICSIEETAGTHDEQPPIPGSRSVSRGSQSVSHGTQSISHESQSMRSPRPEQRQRPDALKPVWQPPARPQQKSSGIVAPIFKTILLAAAGGGIWWAYQNWFAPPTPAFTAYAGYAEAIARGEYQKAADAAQGDGKAYAETWIQMTKPTTMKIYGKEFSMSPPSVSSIAGDIAWIKRKRKSEVKKSDTRVELQVEQTVCRIPPGVSSALCKWPVTFEHDAVLELVDGSWKVSDFKETRLTPQDGVGK